MRQKHEMSWYKAQLINSMVCIQKTTSTYGHKIKSHVVSIKSHLIIIKIVVRINSVLLISCAQNCNYLNSTFDWVLTELQFCWRWGERLPLTQWNNMNDSCISYPQEVIQFISLMSDWMVLIPWTRAVLSYSQCLHITFQCCCWFKVSLEKYTKMHFRMLPEAVMCLSVCSIPPLFGKRTKQLYVCSRTNFYC